MHRIGRTGRSGRTGIATTFINKANDESVLLDLKHLLMEAKQKVPPFLLELCSENEKYLNLGGRTMVYIFLLTFMNLCRSCKLKNIKKTFYIYKDIFLVLTQTNAAAVIVVDLDIESQSVLNWRLYRISRRPILGVAIIWPVTLPITKRHVLNKIVL